jgi:hypothetical protein
MNEHCEGTVKYPKAKIWNRLSTEAKSKLFKYLNGRLPTFYELFGEEDPFDRYAR